jgi:hypothetical protein
MDTRTYTVAPRAGRVRNGHRVRDAHVSRGPHRTDARIGDRVPDSRRRVAPRRRCTRRASRFALGDRKRGVCCGCVADATGADQSADEG